MRYHALACDYDGTLAHDGVVDASTIDALKRLRESGRRLLLVTGRRIEDLQTVFPRLDLFERVVGENGALLYSPATKQERLLGEAPPPTFIERLKAKGVTPLDVGRVIVATREPHEIDVLEAIRDLGLEHQVIFNKGAVMVLPSGVDKATGLIAALHDLGLSPHNAVAVGDAENDHHLLGACECGIAVANAVPSLKEKADWVTPGARGAGVRQLIAKLVESDLAELAPKLTRHTLSIGRTDGEVYRIDGYGPNILLAGASGGGKSTLATALLEQLTEKGYRYCVIDPEGDYSSIEAVTFGQPEQLPDIEQVLKLLRDPEESCVVNLLGVPSADRPRFFARLFTSLLDLRARRGRPHWIVVDETHHMLPAAQHVAQTLIPPGLASVLWLTIHPDHVAREVLALIDVVIAVGDAPEDTLARFARPLGIEAPRSSSKPLARGEAIVWSPRRRDAPMRVHAFAPRVERRRHRRKYATGELLPEENFYFRGPDDRLQLRAQNLSTFAQLADGVDDDTWLFHLHRGDYSRWFLDVIKDESLAEATRRIEEMDSASARDSRALVRQEIEQRYSLPA